MNGLDFPFEALAFNPVNLSPLFAAAFNNLWALFVFIAAALISFKHLRPSTAPKLLHETVLPEDNVDENVYEDVEGKGKGKLLHETVLPENLEGEGVVLTRGNSKKVFTVYYGERENEEGCVGDDDVYGGDEKEEDEEEETDVIVEKWTVEMRGGELGWYDYQDRSVIDGNVVRLWDGEKEKSTSPRRCRNIIIAPLLFASNSSII